MNIVDEYLLELQEGKGVKQAVKAAKKKMSKLKRIAYTAKQIADEKKKLAAITRRQFLKKSGEDALKLTASVYGL